MRLQPGLCGHSGRPIRHRMAATLALALAAALLPACGGGGGAGSGGTTYTATRSVAQKGPLILGSAVTAQELDANLSPTGKQYSYQVDSNLGTFSPTSAFTSPTLGIIASGYYYDEVTNAISSGPITLNGISDLTLDPVLNVNLLTTLAYQRIQRLVTQSGLGYAAARTQAESEVLAALHIPPASYPAFGTLDIGKGRDGDRILAAVSSLFVQGNSAGNLAALIASVQNDIGLHGAITDAGTAAALAASAKALDPAAVAANLTQEYSTLGVTWSANDIGQWIDQDGDGLVGAVKFQVPDASAASVFPFPTTVTNPYAGNAVTASAGALFVNGTAIVGAATLRAGDIVSVQPPAGTFPNGLQTIYLQIGSARAARVTFTNSLSAITVTPASADVPLGLAQQMTATGTFTDGSSADLTAMAAWTSSATSVATVGANTGMLSAVSVGQATVAAAYGGVSGSTPVTIAPAALLALNLDPGPLATGIGLSRQLHAFGTYTDGMRDVSASASWHVADEAIATVAAGGSVRGVSVGTTTLTASLAGLTANGTLAVSTDAWVAAAPMNIARSGHVAISLPGGRVYVYGGIPQNPRSSSPEIYDAAKNAWTPAASLPSIAAAAAVTGLPNGKVLVSGGILGGTGPLPITAAWLYDPATDAWAAAAPMKTGRSQHTATVLANGKVLVAGGGQTGWGIYLASAEIYDPATDTWTPAGSMSTGRLSHFATLLSDGRVLVVGGYGLTSSGNGVTLLSSAEIFDPSTNLWTPVASMGTDRNGFAAAPLRDGRLLVVGGYSATASAVVYTAEIFDPATQQWTPAASLPDERSGMSTTLMPNGTVIAVGGGLPSGAQLTTVEAYDPAANAWTTLSNMPTGLVAHSATVLPNGMLLVAGGHNALAGDVASCWLHW